MAQCRMGIDIGGTFTDLCILDEDRGEFINVKVPSTPKDLTEGVRESLEAFFRDGRTADDLTFLFHATTVATNTLLEQKGASAWLVITQGYTGVYETPELGEIRMGSYNYLSYPKPRLLVPQRRTIQIPERVGSKGEVIKPLDETETLHRLGRLKDAGAESVAVCFLFSFMNPAHELRLRELIHQVVPDAHVFLSCEILPLIREYGRLATTVANAYVAPTVVRYLDRLEQTLVSHNIHRPLYVMQSLGGSLTTGIVRKNPAQIIESGPAAGVLAATYIGRLADYPDVISFDMGGTTAKAGIIKGGEPMTVSRFQAGEWLLSVPSLDLVEIGSGGGSIAFIDKNGMLKVGPQSAGAEPGPACYQKGGQEPTVTDADLVLGWLNPDYFLGGKMPLNREAAEQAVRSHVAEPLGLSTIAAAEGIVRIVNSQMVEALRLVTVSRGEDPRDYTMVAFGGAGPVHASQLAEELKIARVVVPLVPGVFSAMGLLVSDLKREHVQSHLGSLEAVPASEVQSRFEPMEAAARQELVAEGIAEEQIICERILDLRYSIQKYELPVPVANGMLQEADKAEWRELFDQRHELHYGTRATDQAVEIVNYRLMAKVTLPRPDLHEFPPSKLSAQEALKGHRRAYFNGWVDCPVYARERLGYGCSLSGPAIIEQVDCTIVVWPGQDVQVDRFGNVVISVTGETA
ncbi:MAG: hydantoinase/oxoprolinase family protein [Chloroflexi bacterium]|nr:hydantoinase/oxoprolinase family protein [Chloroflexota bacterium]